MHNLAIIPARGGSKRIPRKNIKLFLGKPIIAYSIETALQSRLFDEVMVSTDDEEIAEVALQFGAKVPFLRSKETSSDYATTLDVVNEVLTRYQNELKSVFEYVCCIYPTAPLINGTTLQEGLNLLINNQFDSVLPAVPFSYPVWRGLERTDTGQTKMIWPEYLNSRSQDLKKVYHDAGQWYWIKSNNIKESLFTENTGAIILDQTVVQDIDTLSDWKLAEMKYKLMHEM
ncbi:MAG: pseudaminic acid cytidylyltransferase [Bacteroidetes bacterium GWF2_33_16]|nr:MAG: pseudaminic acid cytidylyltransferase [Bacteroidetes bacterium GWE2_32_14]OFY03391.1 MAG: pseudaminic acid cytidylyltransferase [Bacteroidetes bacterium GWF2_33_16]